MQLARTVGELKRQGYVPRSVREEIRENAIRMLRERRPMFPGIVGYDETVVPQIINAAEGTQVDWNEFENIPGYALMINMAYTHYDARDLDIQHNRFNNVCNFYQDVGAIYTFPGQVFARLWGMRAGAPGLSTMCGELTGVFEDSYKDEYGNWHAPTIQQRRDPPTGYSIPVYKIGEEPVHCTNELQAWLTGRDWSKANNPPIPNMTFYANVTIENNEFQDIRNMHLPAATEPTVSNAPVGIYLDHNPAGLPADLRWDGDPGSTLRIGPNDFININSNATCAHMLHPARRDEGYPQIYPDHYLNQAQNCYYYELDSPSNPTIVFPRHLYDVILNCFGAYGELSHAIWHVPPAGMEEYERQDMWNWSMIAHETTPDTPEPDPIYPPPPPPYGEFINVETTEYILHRHRVTVDDCINRDGDPITAGLDDAGCGWVKDR